MANSSYPLQTPQTLQPPSLLNVDNSCQSAVSADDSPTFLYDLPVFPSTSSFSGRSQGVGNCTPTRPPSRKSLGVSPNDLEQFAEHCRSWYYRRDCNSRRLMTQMLAALPPPQRPPFTRLQTSIRSGYHRSLNARRHAEFQAQLSATIPGGSLMPYARADPRGRGAQKERYERMARFIRNWCNMGMSSTKPFFEALWAVMRLQLISEELGGAGRNRIEWELDDAVIKEAAGKDFMLEAIDLLKGVLGFEEAPSPKIPSSAYGQETDSSLPPQHSRAQSQPLLPHRKPFDGASKIQSKLAQTPSNPFFDAPQTGSMIHSSPPPSANTESLLNATAIEADEPPSPIASYGDDDEPISITQDDISTHSGADEQQQQQPYLRIWTSPDLANSELLQLVKLFPAFISRRRPLPRFPVPVSPNTNSSGHVDNEEGDNDGRYIIQFGTGSICISSKQRTDAWEGGCCTRFVLWWKRIFC